MASIVANIVINGLMAVLLLVTIGYCWILNKRIQILQDSKSELAQLLKYFDESTQRASESIIALQTASKKIGENIQMRIDKANYTIDDLAFIIEKGNKTVNQIEAGMAVQRARTRITASVQQPEEDSEEHIEQAISQFADPVPPPEKPAPEKSAREKNVSSLEAVLERVVNRSKIVSPRQQEEAAPKQSAAPASQARSRSEQELLDMIKAGLKG